MASREDHTKAATAAASFDLMLLKIYYSEAQSDIADDLKEGLITNQTSGDAWELIQTLSEDEEKLVSTPAQLAARHPEECIQLGEIFAGALLTGAGRQGDYYVEHAIPLDRKSAHLSGMFQEMDAPTLARLFQPPRLS